MVKYDLITDSDVVPKASLAQRSLSPLTAGGIRQSMFTLISAAIGGGILCLPYVFSLVGVGMGILLLCIAAVLAYISILMLLLCAQRSGQFSYGRLVSFSTELHYAGPFLDIVSILFSTGVIIAYFVFLGDFVPSVLHVLGLSAPRTACILICCVLATPLALPAKLSALQYLTPISTFSLLMTAAVVAYRAPYMRDQLEPSVAELDVFIFSKSVFKAFAIVISSFICHTNVVSVAGELVKPTDERAEKIAVRAALVQLVLYVLIGSSGYASFSKITQQNFLKGYSDSDPLITLCRVMLSFSIFFGLPLNANPTAKAVVNLVQAFKSEKREPLLPATPSDHTDPQRTLRVSAGITALVVWPVNGSFGYWA